ncbi:MAG: hypothetical protein ABW194_09605 [Novosphingobium sp.]
MIRPAFLTMTIAAACANLTGCAGREAEPDPREAAVGEARALEDAAAMLVARPPVGPAPADRRPPSRSSEEPK